MIRKLIHILKTNLIVWAKRLFTLGDDCADEEVVINGIKAGIDFKGAKLWVLILAIFVASLGLNTNSTAVIIGAMLISPLMGPIIGMGLGIGINDLVVFKKSLSNYLTATIFSVITATFYFLLTPLAEAQSELLARTSPTIYDVLIALCGGLAGIIALGSTSQRTGNVIPGVAIATALMPPLCTVGFSLATGNWLYAAGALFLYVINTVFISLATYVGCRFILNYKPVIEPDAKNQKRTNRIVFAIVSLIIIPAIMLTVRMIQESVFDLRARQFISHELNFPETQILAKEYSYKNRTIRVALLGKETDSLLIKDARQRLADYKLKNVHLEIKQKELGLDSRAVKEMITSQDMRVAKTAEMLDIQKNELLSREQELERYHQRERLAADLYREMQVLFPSVKGISMGLGTQIYTDSITRQQPATLVHVVLQSAMHKNDAQKMENWLKERSNFENLQVVFEVKKK